MQWLMPNADATALVRGQMGDKRGDASRGCEPRLITSSVVKAAPVFRTAWLEDDSDDVVESVEPDRGLAGGDEAPPDPEPRRVAGADDAEPADPLRWPCRHT